LAGAELVPELLGAGADNEVDDVLPIVVVIKKTQNSLMGQYITYIEIS